jgi:hypothetical protein
MPESLPTKPDAVRLRIRHAVTTILVIALSVMIVRDLLVRRWGPAEPPSSDVTRRSP